VNTEAVILVHAKAASEKIKNQSVMRFLKTVKNGGVEAAKLL